MLQEWQGFYFLLSTFLGALKCALKFLGAAQSGQSPGSICHPTLWLGVCFFMGSAVARVVELSTWLLISQLVIQPWELQIFLPEVYVLVALHTKYWKGNHVQCLLTAAGMITGWRPWLALVFPLHIQLGTLADELASRLLKCSLYVPHRKNKDRLEQKKFKSFLSNLKLQMKLVFLKGTFGQILVSEVPCQNLSKQMILKYLLQTELSFS